MRVAKHLRALLLPTGLSLTLLFAQEKQPRKPDVRFVATPQEVVDQMLKLAGVGPDDVVYDLGCGDGRIVISAARDFGARGVGIDIDPERIKDSQAYARRAGVEDRVTFRTGDLFEADISDATVVTLYLLPSLNRRLRPKLWKELQPGTRIVSHNFDMDEWEPEKEMGVASGTIFLWTIPEGGESGR